MCLPNFTCGTSIISTSYQKLPFGSGDDPEMVQHPYEERPRGWKRPMLHSALALIWQDTAAVVPCLSGSFVIPGITLSVSGLRSPVQAHFRDFIGNFFFLSFSSIWPFLKIWLPSSTCYLYEISPTIEAQFLDTAVVYVKYLISSSGSFLNRPVWFTPAVPRT